MSYIVLSKQSLNEYEELLSTTIATKGPEEAKAVAQGFGKYLRYLESEQGGSFQHAINQVMAIPQSFVGTASGPSRATVSVIGICTPSMIVGPTPHNVPRNTGGMVPQLSSIGLGKPWAGLDAGTAALNPLSQAALAHQRRHQTKEGLEHEMPECPIKGSCELIEDEGGRPSQAQPNCM